MLKPKPSSISKSIKFYKKTRNSVSAQIWPLRTNLAISGATDVQIMISWRFWKGKRQTYNFYEEHNDEFHRLNGQKEATSWNDGQKRG